MAGAERTSLTTVKWDISGDCQNPYHTEIWGRAEPREGYRERIIDRSGAPQFLDLWTRCRRCRECLRARQRRWFGAARTELQVSSRSWFGTLTLSPASQFRALSIARQRLAKQGVDFDCLSPREQFLERHRAIGPELQKFLKRVRKNAKTRFRYLLVCEAHESGLPHYHVLIHEPAGERPIPHRILSAAWTLGFEKFRLSDPDDPKAALYLTKYLAKSLEARVRASQRYGGVSNDLRAYAIAELDKLGVKSPTKEALF